MNKLIQITLCSIPLCLGACAKHPQSRTLAAPAASVMPNISVTGTVLDVPNSAIPDAGISQIVKGNGWQVAIPNGWSKIDTSNVDGLFFVYQNSIKHNIISLMGENFEKISLEQYVAVLTQALQQQGANVLATTEVAINDRDYALLHASKDTSELWIWATLVGNAGYNLTCGGLAYETDNQNICQNVVNSLQFTTQP